MKIEAAPDLLARIRLYAEPFRLDRRHSHPVFAHFPPANGEGADPAFSFAADSDRGLGILLLVAALHRPEGEAAAARVVAGLYRAHGNDVFRLNRLPFEPLRDEIAALTPGMDATDRDRIPGILRSVCDFFYRVGPLGAWLSGKTGERAPDWESRAGELCNEIYWMGQHSRARTKARLFLWLACLASESDAGASAAAARYPQAAQFMWPVSEGHMRFRFDILRPARSAGTSTDRSAGTGPPEERLQAFAVLARAAFPAEPWLLFRPLDAYLRRDGRGDYVCRAVQGGCRPCALATLCPAAGNFLPGEG